MKAKVILFVITAMIMAACSKTSEDKVTEVFKEYVKTDFGNPDDFIEITKIEKPDTIDVDRALSLTTGIDSILWVFPEKEQKNYEYRKQQLIEDNPCVVIYKLNVRIAVGDDKVMRNYWVVEQDGEMKVQDEEPTIDQMPYSFAEFSKTLSEMYATFLKAVGEME